VQGVHYLSKEIKVQEGPMQGMRQARNLFKCGKSLIGDRKKECVERLSRNYLSSISFKSSRDTRSAPKVHKNQRNQAHER
jgi:hypothetical protein